MKHFPPSSYFGRASASRTWRCVGLRITRLTDCVRGAQQTDKLPSHVNNNKTGKWSMTWCWALRSITFIALATRRWMRSNLSQHEIDTNLVRNDDMFALHTRIILASSTMLLWIGGKPCWCSFWEFIFFNAYIKRSIYAWIELFTNPNFSSQPHI